MTVLQMREYVNYRPGVDIFGIEAWRKSEVTEVETGYDFGPAYHYLSTTDYWEALNYVQNLDEDYGVFSFVGPRR